MRNAKLEAVITALGYVPAAYHTGKSIQAVYGWLKAGRIFDAQDCLKIHRLAREAGLEVTLEELAGLTVVNGNGSPKGGRGKHRHQAENCAPPQGPDLRLASTQAGPSAHAA